MNLKSIYPITINFTAKWRYYLLCTGFLRCIKKQLDQDLLKLDDDAYSNLFQRNSLLYLHYFIKKLKGTIIQKIEFILG